MTANKATLVSAVEVALGLLENALLSSSPSLTHRELAELAEHLERLADRSREKAAL